MELMPCSILSYASILWKYRMIVRVCEVLRKNLGKRLLFLIGLCFWVWFLPLVGYGQSIRFATTTSLEDSGLLAYLWDAYVRLDESRAHPHAIIVGSGAALELARRGDVDFVIVHDAQSEKEFIAKGYGVKRLPWIRNDFVLLGPDLGLDPAITGVSDAKDILGALTALARRSQEKGDISFVSRGDQSGTHKRELHLFEAIGLKPLEVFGDRFLVTGQGMGASLNIAIHKRAFILSDFGSWQNRTHHNANMRIWFAKDPLLYNPYSVIVLDPQHMKTSTSNQIHHLLLWLFSQETRTLIKNYTLHQKAIFTPHQHWPSLEEIHQIFR